MRETQWSRTKKTREIDSTESFFREIDLTSFSFMHGNFKNVCM